MSPEHPAPIHITCVATFPEQLSSYRAPFMSPTHLRPQALASDSWRGAGWRLGAVATNTSVTSATPGGWHSAIPAERDSAAAFLRAGPGPGSCHARQLHLLLRWSREIQAAVGQAAPLPCTATRAAERPGELPAWLPLQTLGGLWASAPQFLLQTNVYVPPVHVWKPSPSCDDVRRRGLWEVIRS